MRQLFLSVALFLLLTNGHAQTVGVGTTVPNASAILDVSSTSKGLLPPRMTYSQRKFIANPAAGLIIWCTDCDTSGQLQVYNGKKWVGLVAGEAATPVPVILPSVTIGAQTWMAKNLDVTTYANGDPIPKVTDPLVWQNLTTGAWCWYFNDSVQFSSYGKLYNWYAVNDPRGLAPNGWHIPTDTEWNILVRYLDASIDTTCSGCAQSSTAGAALKETGTSHWVSPNTGATNSSNFTAFAGGYRYTGGNFYDLGFYGYWWTATSSSSPGSAFYRQLYYSNTNIVRNSNLKGSGYSVRCVRD